VYDRRDNGWLADRAAGREGGNDGCRVTDGNERTAGSERAETEVSAHPSTSGWLPGWTDTGSRGWTGRGRAVDRRRLALFSVVGRRHLSAGAASSLRRRPV